MGTVPIWSFSQVFTHKSFDVFLPEVLHVLRAKELPVESVGLEIPDSFLCPRCSQSAFLLPSSWLWDTFLAVDTGIINCSADVDESLP